MKHGRKPTVAQANLIRSIKASGGNLDPAKWLLVKNTSTEMVIVNRGSGRQRTIKKAPPKGQVENVKISITNKGAKVNGSENRYN